MEGKQEQRRFVDKGTMNYSLILARSLARLAACLLLLFLGLFALPFKGKTSLEKFKSELMTFCLAPDTKRAATVQQLAVS